MLDLSRDEKAKNFLPRWLLNVANVELLPIPMLPVYNCPIMPPPSLEIGIGYWQYFHTGNIRLPSAAGTFCPASHRMRFTPNNNFSKCNAFAWGMWYNKRVFSLISGELSRT